MSDDADPRRKKKLRTRSNRCGPCPLRYAQGGPPGTFSCKSDPRLCQWFDISFVEHFPGRTVAEYIAMQQKIATGYAVAQSELLHEVFDVDTELDFLVYIRRLHATIFSDAYGETAGRFRATGEDSWVGHSVHEFTGAPPADIEPRLRALARRLPIAKAPLGQDAFARWAAEFCQEYFAIHPFADGNGRTGRFLVEAAAWATDALMVRPEEFLRRGAKTRDREKYIYALQYAHKHCGVSRVSQYLGGGPRDPFRYLTAWWRERIMSTSFDWELDDGQQSDDPWIDHDVIAEHVRAMEELREEMKPKPLPAEAMSLRLSPPERPADAATDPGDDACD